MEIYLKNGCEKAMLDTADKKAGRLTDCLPQARLRCFVAAAQQLGLLCGLAGSLRRQDIPALAVLAPDYLGFRGALCVEGSRTAAFDLALMHAIAQMLRECNIRVGAVA